MTELMKIQNGQRYLVTSESWFFGTDGNVYRSAWGRVYIETTEETLGFKPSRPSTNWYMRIGDGENSVIIAGCQIHYLIRCENRPTRKAGTYQRTDSGELFDNNSIWFTE